MRQSCYRNDVVPRISSLLVVALLGLTTAGCSRTEPVYDVNVARVTGANGQVSADQVRSAIINALRTNGWTVRREYPDKIIADLSFRAHTATIEIDYSPASYAISHRSSENLLFDGSEIHGNYNKLIKRLEDEINRNLTFA